MASSSSILCGASFLGVLRHTRCSDMTIDDEDDEEDIGMEGAEKEGVIAMAGGCAGSYSRDILRARPLLFWEIEV